MPLPAGTKLGTYEIVGPIGAGGMGEVYRARDTRLHRDVAIKILPDLFASDPDRIARFEREATTLASLNHPNIAQIYGHLGPAEHAPHSLVMELVEGETLAERIARGPLPVDDALPVARQVADALEAAHDCGIVHRDLKPGNVRIRPDGTVKVLDFGLAKSVDPSRVLSGVDSANSPTFTSPAATGIGVILGTAAYMAPEQARGKPVDSRADIWAFGVLLHEMLTGRQLFTGATVSDVLASILRDGPKWEDLPRDTPASVRTLLRRCLQKDPQLRLRHAGDARLELTDVDAASPAPEAAASGAVSWTRAALLAASAAALTLVAALLLAPRFIAAPELPVRKWIIPQESADERFGRENIPAISQDGRRLAYTDGERLRIRDLTSFETRDVQVAGVAGMPSWSPDGEFVAFFTEHKILWKVSKDGGSPTKICDLPPGVVFGIAWRPDRTIVVNMAYGPAAAELFSVSEGGGRPERLTLRDAPAASAFYARGLPDGSLIYVRRHDGKVETVLDRPGQPLKTYALPWHFGISYARSGHLVYSGRETPGVWAVPFDYESGDLKGEPFRIAETGIGPVVSNDGTLAYGRTVPGQRQLAWFDRDGTVRSTIGQPQDSMRSPAISPDGTRVAVAGLENGLTNIWVHEIARPVKGRVTFGAEDVDPAWHPTDGRIAFQTGNWDILTATAETAGEPKTVVSDDVPEFQPLWSRDGKYLVYAQFSAQGKGDIWMIGPGGQRTAIVHGPFSEISPALSPDGRFIAYASDETGTYEVFVRSFPDGQGKRQVSSGGGMWPRWRGNEIFFVERVTLMSAAVRTAPTLHVETPKPLFKLEDRGNGFPIFDTVDGQRFIVTRTIKPPQNGIAIVQNWVGEFKQR